MEHTIGYIKEPLRLIFHIGSTLLYLHLSLQCVLTIATNYNILIGQHAIYLLGFGLDNSTKEAWIQPRWSAGDRRKEFILLTFATGAMSMWAERLCFVVAL